MTKSNKGTQKMVAATTTVETDSRLFSQFVAKSNAAFDGSGALADWCEFSIKHKFAGDGERCNAWIEALEACPDFKGTRDRSQTTRRRKLMRQPEAFLALVEARDSRDDWTAKRYDALMAAHSVFVGEEKDSQGNIKIVKPSHDRAIAELEAYDKKKAAKVSKPKPKPNSQAALKAAIEAAWIARKSLRKLDAANMTLEALAVHFGIVEMED